jgi:hypothetical protein
MADRNSLPSLEQPRQQTRGKPRTGAYAARGFAGGRSGVGVLGRVLAESRKDQRAQSPLGSDVKLTLAR